MSKRYKKIKESPMQRLERMIEPSGLTLDEFIEAVDDWGEAIDEVMIGYSDYEDFYDENIAEDTAALFKTGNAYAVINGSNLYYDDPYENLKYSLVVVTTDLNKAREALAALEWTGITESIKDTIMEFKENHPEYPGLWISHTSGGYSDPQMRIYYDRKLIMEHVRLPLDEDKIKGQIERLRSFEAEMKKNGYAVFEIIKDRREWNDNQRYYSFVFRDAQYNDIHVRKHIPSKTRGQQRNVLDYICLSDIEKQKEADRIAKEKEEQKKARLEEAHKHDIVLKIYVEEHRVLVFEGKNTKESPWYVPTNMYRKDSPYDIDDCIFSTTVYGPNHVMITREAIEAIKELYRKSEKTGDDISPIEIFRMQVRKNGRDNLGCFSYEGKLKQRIDLNDTKDFWWGIGEGEPDFSVLEEMVIVDDDKIRDTVM